jgi:hypothetical protein
MVNTGMGSFIYKLSHPRCTRSVILVLFLLVSPLLVQSFIQPSAAGDGACLENFFETIFTTPRISLIVIRTTSRRRGCGRLGDVLSRMVFGGNLGFLGVEHLSRRPWTKIGRTGCGPPTNCCLLMVFGPRCRDMDAHTRSLAKTSYLFTK